MHGSFNVLYNHQRNVTRGIMVNDRKRKSFTEDVGDQNPSESTLTSTISAPPSKRARTRRELFVRGLAPTVTNELLVEHFSDSFPVKHGVTVSDSEGKCRGFGFVTFADADDAAQAQLQFQNSILLGRKIKLETAEPRHRDIDDTLPSEVAAALGKQKSTIAPEAIQAKERRRAELEAQRKANRPPRLIIRNLPWSIKSEEDLEKIFQSFGKVTRITLPRKGPGELRGFGFVTLRGKKNAENAVSKVNGKTIDGRVLAVDWAVEKATWEEQMKGTMKDEADEQQLNSPDSESGSEYDSSEDEGLRSEPGLEPDDALNHSEESVDSKVIDESQVTTHPSRGYQSIVFIRNLPFTSTDEQLHDHFAHFGPIKYAKVVLDSSTERPRGTGFVCFKKEEDMKVCIRDSPRQRLEPGIPGSGPSILQQHELDPTGNYTLDGRVLSVTRAVDRDEAARLAENTKSARAKQDPDRRRLYLLNEGTVRPGNQLYESLAQTELSIREASFKQRKALIQSNPSLHLSLTRLSVRNIPRTVTSKDLKQLAVDAVVGFAKDVKSGKRDKLSKEELQRGAHDMELAERGRKVKGKGVVKQAKIVFESKEGTKIEESTSGGRSRGYGFIEYYTHRSALMGLRWLNGHSINYTATESTKDKKLSKEERQDRRKRLIAEFAIDNAQVVQRRTDRENRAKNRQVRGDNDDVNYLPLIKSPYQRKDVVQDSQERRAGMRSEDNEADTTFKDLDKTKKRQKIIAAKRARKNGKRAAKT